MDIVQSSSVLSGQETAILRSLVETELRAKSETVPTVVINVGTTEDPYRAYSREGTIPSVSSGFIHKSGSHMIPLCVAFGAAVVDFLWIPTGTPPFAVGAFNALCVVIAHLGYKA